MDSLPLRLFDHFMADHSKALSLRSRRLDKFLE
jgi:hypothetical protein